MTKTRIDEVRSGHVRGWSFTPLRKGTKRPKHNDWPRRPRESVDEAVRWAEEGNVGLRTGKISGVIVLDVDLDRGGAVPAGLPKTPTVRTGGGGLHLYFSAPPGRSVKNSASKIAPHVDVRGDGGQAVFVGSTHPDTGVVYAWEPGLSPDDVPLAPFPVALLDKHAAPPSPPPPRNGNNGRGYAQAALSKECDAVANAPEGQRNHTLNRAAYCVAGYLHGGKITEDEMIRTLLNAATAAGLPEGEARATIRSGISEGRAKPRNIPKQKMPAPPRAPISPPPGIEDALPESDEVFIPYAVPMRIAESLIEHTFNAEKQISLLKQYQGVWWNYEDGAYRQIADETLARDIYQFLDRAITYRRDKDGEIKYDDIGKTATKKLVANSRQCNEVTKALPAVSGVLITEHAPVWLNDTDGANPHEIVACRNGLLHVPSGALQAATPDFFSVNSLPYEYLAESGEPVEWLKFLISIWEDDEEAIRLLQDWFGYCLLTDTSQQKMLLVIGPKRSGKGTIARVLTALLGGSKNVAGPTLASLSGPFGLESVQDKPLAIISDARLSGRTDQAIITERLLAISGEDSITVDRKHTTSITLKLPTRFMLLSNELPSLSDTSSALAGRFVILEMTKSFFDKEDRGLFGRLNAELPGILNWAIAGWCRLQERGYFRVPRSSQAAMDDLLDLSSPLTAFLRECCDVSPERSIATVDLFDCWRRWCERNGRRHPGTLQSFAKNLRATEPNIETVRATQSHGERERRFNGVGLNDDQ